MDNANFSDIGSMLSTLRDNPQLLRMLMSLMGNAAQKPEDKPEPPAADPLSMLMNMVNGASSSPEKPQKPISPFGDSEDIKNRICLLNAVRPYLSEARCERLDLVIKLLRMAEVGGLSSLLGKA